MKGAIQNRGVHHVGLTVPDGEAASRFLTDVLGCERMFEVCDIAFDTPNTAASIGVDAGTRIRKLIFLRCGNGASIEVFEYEAARQSPDRPRNSDHAGHHIAFQVDDIEVASRRIEAGGGRLCGTANVAADSPFGGLKWLYFVAPWGLQLELVQPPGDGVEFEQRTGRKLYEP
jgi:catechol 2,3-dioxygenase-like lactoylglutathione lyase family enzyme